MSYVLEALKRADAQRERGEVPGLHAQPDPLPPAPDEIPPAARWPAWAAGGLALLVLGLAAIWWLGRAPQTPPAVAPPTAQTPATATPAAAQPPGPVVQAPPAEPLRVVPTRPPAPPVPTTARADAAVAPPASAPAKATRLPTLRELPPALQRELPALALGGSMYSAQASQRLVIVNGQVFHEGGQPAPELTIEQIRPKSLVLRFRDQRFELPL
jgi:general secretion pathway protein B